ncbi:MAG: hypothetical protein Q7R69_03645 [bacterium]|nr:hypothetical protein [bacterium]
MPKVKKELGKVTHWYDKIGVGVVKMAGSLKVGDRIKVSHGDEEFDCAVESMQIEHESVESAKKGDEAAIKFPQKAKEGSIVSPAE